MSPAAIRPDRAWIRAAALGGLLAASGPARVRAEAELPVIAVEMRDGTIIPPRIEVPANTRFKIEIRNTGASPVEFESAALKREKAVAPGDTVPLVFRSVPPGEYDVFDDFHPDAKAVLVAR